MERVKSIFRRNTERRRHELRNPDGEPNGINIEHTTHDQNRPLSQSQAQANAPSLQQQRLSQQPRSAIAGDGPVPTTPATQTGRLDIELQNDTNTSPVYAYISKPAPHEQTT